MTVPPPKVSAFLEEWVGAWPPSRPVTMVQDPTPEAPSWDGTVRGALGVADAAGAAVLRLPPAATRRWPDPPPGDVRTLIEALPPVMQVPGIAGMGTLRWAVDVPSAVVLPDAGVWLPAALGETDDPRVAPWLLPFGGDVLVALDENDRYLAGVGLKRHNDLGWEIAVVTDERARGRGFARRLVAQASRRVLEQGLVVIYLHGRDNLASARVADATGFPDQGWGVVGFWPS